MELLLSILCLCVIARFIQQFCLDIKNSYFDKRYESLNKKFYDSEYLHEEEIKMLREILKEKNETIEELKKQQRFGIKIKNIDDVTEVNIVDAEEETDN